MKIKLKIVIQIISKDRNGTYYKWVEKTFTEEQLLEYYTEKMKKTHIVNLYVKKITTEE